MTPPATETISEPRAQELKSRSQTWLGQRSACRDHQPEMIQPPAVFPATVVGRNEACGLLELEMDDSPGAIVLAAIAMLPKPSFIGGERVLVMPGPIDPIHERNTWFVTAVMEMAAEPPRRLPNDQQQKSWTLSDGTRVLCDPQGESVEWRDASDRLCFRYDSHDQSVTIAAHGDLRLESTDGDVQIVAHRQLALTGREAVHAATPRLEVDASEAELRGGRLQLTFGQFRWLGQRCEFYGEQLRQVVRNLYSHVTECFQLKAGESRTSVDENAELHAGKVRIKSKDDVTIDGKQIHLG